MKSYLNWKEREIFDFIISEPIAMKNWETHWDDFEGLGRKVHNFKLAFAGKKEKLFLKQFIF